MKIGFLITARLKSSRLPYKLLLGLNGKTMVERVIDRAKQVIPSENVILCTSTFYQDNPLEVIAKKAGIQCFRGSEGDVLTRLKDAAETHSLDYVINITGENPLFSIDMAHQLKTELIENQADFAYIEGLPIGCAVYGLKTRALKVVCQIKEEIDTEIWGHLINQPDVFNVLRVETPEHLKLENIRITSDYPEDFELISQLFHRFDKIEIPSYADVRKLLLQETALLDINSMRQQASLNSEIVKKISDFYKNNLEQIRSLKDKVYSGNE